MCEPCEADQQPGNVIPAATATSTPQTVVSLYEFVAFLFISHMSAMKTRK